MNSLFQKILESRGLDESFLCPKYEDLSAPEELPDMEKLIRRLGKAKEHKEKVLIYGDYDVDGVTATAIVYNALKLAGITELEMMLPDRFIDGYGMSRRLVEQAKKNDIQLVITVDCGSNNAEIIDELSKANIDVLVTDHHELMSGVPKTAVAVVNPKRDDFRKKVETDHELSGLANLSGAGVAFMLARALVNAGMIPDGQEKWLLDLAMIGTICDSMKLTNDNRIICHFGMIVLEKTKRIGLKELMRVAGVSKINTDAVGFQIGPRLNAAGRMKTAEVALKLLTTGSKAEAAKLAKELNELNAERRRQQNQAIDDLEKNGIDDAPVIVARGKWGEGVVGIIAGRLTERYKRPSFVLTETEEGLKGSGRSFGEFNLALACKECQKLLIAGGGHAEACGVKLENSNYEAFKEKVNDYYRSLKLENQERFLEAKEDIATSALGELNLELTDCFNKMEPFGEGNPAPVILLTNVLILNIDRIGDKKQHLRMLVRGDDEKTLKLVAFNAPKNWLGIDAGEKVDIWMSILENEWNGIRSVEGRILGLQLCF